MSVVNANDIHLLTVYENPTSFNVLREVRWYSIKFKLPTHFYHKFFRCIFNFRTLQYVEIWYVGIYQFRFIFQNNLLLIKNLSGFLSKTALIKELLKILPEDVNMTDVYKRYNYAIIQFVFQKDANNAVQLLRGKDSPVILPK